MNFQQQAVDALLESDPLKKGGMIQNLHKQLQVTDELKSLVSGAQAIDTPGIPDEPRLVHPRDLKRRGSGSKEGRRVLLHAIAHIEFNAMNLAMDAAVRFQGLPEAYYRDWIAVAADEARHYRLLSDRLADFGTRYGDYPAHSGLWDMAVRTAHDPLDRMALVPRILEARGLDVTPSMIQQFERANDHKSAEMLGVILEEEVAHVAAGTHWFRYLCEQRSLDPELTWFERVQHYLGNDVRCPVNTRDRNRAGFKASELEWLRETCRQAAISS